MKDWTEVVGDIPSRRASVYSDAAELGIADRMAELEQENARLSRVATATAGELYRERDAKNRALRDVARLDKRIAAADGAIQNLSSQLLVYKTLEAKRTAKNMAKCAELLEAK